MSAVLFADLTGFGALTRARGDEAAADVATRFAALVRQSLDPDGRLLKTLGDGALVVTADISRARATAARLLDAVRRDPDLPPVRVGICGGPVVWRDGDVFGAAVNDAARLVDEARPWEILERQLVLA